MSDVTKAAHTHGQPRTSQVALILLGASEWPHWSDFDNPAFRGTHDAVLNYAIRTFGIQSDQILDLFDVEDSPGELVAQIRAFLGRADMSELTDVIVYFVGHGDTILDDNDYALFTASANRNQPDSSSFRATHLFEAVRPSGRKVRTSILLDACFSAAVVSAFWPAKASKGVAVLASASNAEKSAARKGADKTVFATALLNVLERGDPEKGRYLSLREIGRLVRDELSVDKDNALPEVHSPQQSHGDIADSGIFPNPAYAYASTRPWNRARQVWCAVISASDSLSPSGDIFKDAIQGFIDRYQSKIHTETGWLLEDAPIVIEAGQVMASPAAFRAAVRDVCTADLAFFDLTAHEPAPLILLGIRAVIRRGVTICSTADSFDVDLGSPPPFLLRDINEISHGPLVSDPEEIFGVRALAGIRQLLRSPHRYADLPAFDAIRSLPTDLRDRTIIPFTKRVLVFCSFGSNYTHVIWPQFLRRLRGAIARRAGSTDDSDADVRIERTVDMDSPRVISQNLLEAIRFTDFCICDCTEWKPNVMFELGLRLASNQLPPVCVVSEDDTGTEHENTTDPIRAQFAHLLTLFDVLKYDPKDRDAYYQMVEKHLNCRDTVNSSQDLAWSETNLPPGGVYREAWRQAEMRHETSAQPVVELLAAAASELQIEKQRGSSPFLFPVAHSLTGLARHNELERLIAAWMYIKHRLTIPVVTTDPSKEHFIQLGYRLVELLAAGETSEENEGLLTDVLHDIELLEKANDL